MPGPTSAQRALLALPFVAGLTWLALPLFGDTALRGVELLVGPILVLALLLAVPALLLRSRYAPDPDERRRLVDLALLLPCALAPLLVATTWAVAPSRLGVGFGSFPFFLDWLVRYPNLGPVNYEVLLGIGAVLGTSAVPVVLAAHAWLGRAARPSVVAILAALQLVAYVPVLVRLDAELLLFAVWTSEGWEVPLAVASLAGGPLLRAVATLTMIAYLPITLFRSRAAARAVWEE